VSEDSKKRGAGLSIEYGRVVKILAKRRDAVELLVELSNPAAPEKAIFYPQLGPEPIDVGDSVLLNTTAVRLGLGTGGYHFVIRRLRKGSRKTEIDAAGGHIMKLRYTPMQIRCLAAEEPQSPHHEVLAEAQSIEGMPVVVAGLHSQIAPIAAAIKAETKGKAKIVYIMNDTACLALGFSRLVAELKEKRLIDATITAGQAFGGDLEAVNIYSALLAAKKAAGADVAIIAQGPGNVGTETLFGFGSIYQGEAINAVGILGGTPVAAVRLSFADARPRHRGISEQCLVALGKVALHKSLVVLPKIEKEKLDLLQQQLADSGICQRHEVVIEEGEAGLKELQRLGVKVVSMGRGIDEDREFFLAAAAAGLAAGKQVSGS